MTIIIQAKMQSTQNLLNTRQILQGVLTMLMQKLPTQKTEGNVVNNPAYDANKSGKKEVEIAIPLKYLRNFWRALKIPLINCEVSLI